MSKKTSENIFIYYACCPEQPGSRKRWYVRGENYVIFYDFPGLGFISS